MDAPIATHEITCAECDFTIRIPVLAATINGEPLPDPVIVHSAEGHQVIDAA